MNNIKEIVSTNLIKLRKNANLTQAELAEKLNYSDKAVSKWERGDSLPDISTFKQISEIYGVSIDSILSEQISCQTNQTKVRKQKNKIMIVLMSSLLPWLVMTLLFVALSIAPLNLEKTWLCFVYAIPISAIVLIVFSALWSKPSVTCLFVSILIWSLCLSIFLTFTIEKIWLLFIVCIPLQVLAIIWFAFRSFRTKKQIS